MTISIYFGSYNRNCRRTNYIMMYNVFPERENREYLRFMQVFTYAVNAYLAFITGLLFNVCG